MTIHCRDQRLIMRGDKGTLYHCPCSFARATGEAEAFPHPDCIYSCGFWADLGADFIWVDDDIKIFWVLILRNVNSALGAT